MAHDRPKQLYVRALVKHAERKLRARHLPAELQAYEREVSRQCPLAHADLTSLWQTLDQHVPESRDVHGLRHRQPTVLTIVFAFLLAGGEGGHRAVALFARDLTQKQRAALRCYFNWRTRQFDVPGENCFFRVLQRVPVREFQLALWAWQKARLGGTDGDAVVLDGKALRGSQGTQLVGAINAANGRTLGVEPVADKSNEIPAARTLLERLELDGTIALMDALHTQVETARTVVQGEGGDYVLIIKANQSGLLEQAQNLLPEDFSPSIPDGGEGHGRIEWRSIKLMNTTPAQMGFPFAEQLGRLDRFRYHLKTGKFEVETVWVITSLTAAKAGAVRLLELARLYWSIENGLHYRLDVSAGEDKCRVQHPVAATVYGLLRRATQGTYRAWAKRQRKPRDRTCPTFKAKMKNRLSNILRYLNGDLSRL